MRFPGICTKLYRFGTCVLFQHNVETTIWQRHAHQVVLLGESVLSNASQEMETYERRVCGKAKHVIAVSDIDALRMKRMFGIESVSGVSTGVDTGILRAPDSAPHVSDIVFCGSMDWLPNVDAVEFFVSSVLPLILNQLPNTTFTIAGRSPDARVLKAVEGLPGVRVTGKVEDMRPYLWGSKISVVPIRIGGGTRLKIYECMAAGVPVVSTTVGAEGLRYTDGEDLILADDPCGLAVACVRLLSDEAARRTIAHNALGRAQNELSWKAVSWEFEAILDRNRVSANCDLPNVKQ